MLADTGFKTLGDVSGTTNVDDYSRSGTGAALKFPDGVSEDVIKIAEGVLMHCPFIFGVRSAHLANWHNNIFHFHFLTVKIILAVNFVMQHLLNCCV